MQEEGEEVELTEGMPVTSEDGQSLGKLSSLLIPEDEEDAEFLLIDVAGTDRLVPMEAVLGVGDGALILDVPATAVGKFPHLRSETEPTEDEIALAYRIYEENAVYEADDDEDDDA